MRWLKRLVWRDLGLAVLRYELMTLKTAKKYQHVGGGVTPCILASNNDICTCGGLCDRLHGMLSVYKLCKEEQLDFKIWHTTPFHLEEFLIPQKYNWIIDDTSVVKDLHHVMILKSTMPNILKTGMSWPQARRFHAKYLKNKFIQAKRRHKLQVHVYTNAHIIERDEFHVLFNELFQPTKELREIVEWNKKQLGEHYVSASLRFRNMLGDFKDGDSEPLDKTEQAYYLRRCFDEIEKIHEVHKDKKILVTSDSSTFIEAIKVKEYVYTIPGQIGHIDYSGGEDRNVHLKTFVDLLTLAGADTLYQIFFGKMYGGGFSATAAYIGGKPFIYAPKR